ncbi:MAG: oxidoreductase, partial [Candidatus Bathyarchaeota archaeon]|nr:oxidoreductase [Candidatus Bathyarchaeota archaeon]
MAKEKLKFAFYWAASCGGCEITVLDINEKILDVVAIADIVFWPVAIDIKYKDVEAMPDKYIDVCFFNGAIRTEEQEHMAKLLRKKSKVLVAFGSCACRGGIPGLANVANRREVFERAYLQSPSTINPNSVTPKTSFKVPEGE